MSDNKIIFKEMWWLIGSAPGFGGRGPGFKSSISHNDPDALQEHCVIDRVDFSECKKQCVVDANIKKEPKLTFYGNELFCGNPGKDSDSTYLTKWSSWARCSLAEWNTWLATVQWAQKLEVYSSTTSPGGPVGC